MAVQLLTDADVNGALLQRVADELNIGVPIHAWAVEEGRLRLSLAYGQEVVWPQERDTEGRGEEGSVRLGVDYEWEAVEGELPPIPQELAKLKKQVLARLAIKHGIRIKRPKNFLKAELVEVLERRRGELEIGD